jgi:hypothetical protein
MVGFLQLDSLVLTVGIGLVVSILGRLRGKEESHLLHLDLLGQNHVFTYGHAGLIVESEQLGMDLIENRFRLVSPLGIGY